MFNHTRLCIYPIPEKFVFYYGTGLRGFVPLLNCLSIKPFFITLKNPQSNASVEKVHQIMYDIIVTKDLGNKVFDYIYSRIETLSYIVW